MISCDVSRKDRLERCAALKLRPLCASEKQVEASGKDFFGLVYTILFLVITVYPDVVNTCINTGVADQPYILPF